MKIKLLVLIFLVVLKAQTFSIVENNLSDLLDNQSIHTIIQDSESFMWIGTEKGLYRYNGNQLVRFFLREQNKLDNYDEYINNIMLDHKNELWVSTDNGLYHIQNPFLSIIRYSKEGKKNQQLTDNFVHTVVADSNNNLWISTDGGLSFLNQQNNSIQQFKYSQSQENGLQHYHVICSFIDHKNQLWFGTTLRLHKQVSFGKFKDYPFKGSSKFNMSTLFHANRITALNEVDDYLLVGATSTFSIFKHSDFINKKLKIDEVIKLNQYQVNSILVDKQKRIWLGTNKGLQLLELKNNALKNLSIGLQKFSFYTQSINTLYQDKNGLIWIGTKNGFYTLQEEFLTSHYNSLKTKTSSSKNVTVIKNDPKGNLWIGTTDGVFYRQNNKWIQFKSNDSETENVSQLTFFNNKSLIVSYFGDHFSIHNLSKKSFFHFKESIELSFPKIFFPLKNSSSFLAGDTYRGLGTFNEKTQTIKRYNKLSSALSSEKINDMVQLTDSTYLIATTRGLDELNFFSKKITSRLTDFHIKSITKKKDIVWLGTFNKGIISYNYLTNKIAQVINVENKSLRSNTIVKLISDSNNLHILSENGYSILNFENQNISNMPLFFENLKINFNTMFLDQDSLYIGTNLGYFSFSKINRSRKHFQKTIITKVTHNNKILFDDFTQTNSHNIPYFENTLSFEFSNLDITYSKSLKFKYKLSGLDNTFHFTANEKRTTYSNVSSGNYTFNVYSANSVVIWDTKGDQFRFTILKPFWETWWFITSLISLLFGLFYFFFQIRKRKEVELQGIRKKLAIDLHDHIGSTLTEITFLAEMAQLDKENIPERLITIEEKSRQSIHEMSDLVWTLNSTDHIFSDLIDRMKEFSQNLLSYNHITVEFIDHIAEREAHLNPFFRQHLYFLFKEIIHNVVKHSKATIVIISISDKVNFELRIKDNGIGYIISKATGNGLNNINERVKAINGRQIIHTNNGVDITIQVEKKWFKK